MRSKRKQGTIPGITRSKNKREPKVPEVIIISGGITVVEIKADIVKQLREKTGAGLMDCKRALEENNGDMDKATDYLRAKGIVQAEKRQGRATKEGRIGIYLHRPGEQIGVMIEVNCESDFVARTEEFAAFLRDIAMHVAAANPRFVARAEVPADVIEREKAIYKQQAIESGKPEKIHEKIVEGKVEKFFNEICLLEQKFIRDQDRTIEEMRREFSNKTGENIIIRRFKRFQVGEAL
jgi:elongation factor Ts